MSYDKKLGYDPQIKDYSALIADTKDAQTRAALLEQRQNKLDHLESTGGSNAQWVDNSTVSTWTSTYRPGGWNDDTASYNPKGASPDVGLSVPAGYSGFDADRAYSEYRTLVEDQYNKSAAARQQALRESVNQGVAALQDQAQDVNAGYDDLARQAYVSYMQGAKTLPYALSAGGLTGGATESAMVSLGTSYQETLGQSERERLKALRSIDSDIASLLSTGSIEQANSAAQNATQYASALQDIYQSLLSAQQNEAQSIANNAYRQQQLSTAAQQQEYERRLATAKLLAQAGDFSGYAGLGIDTASLEEAYKQALKPADTRTGAAPAGTGKTGAREVASAVAQMQQTAQTREQSEEALALAELVDASSGAAPTAAAQTAARTYVRELMRLYANDAQQVVAQVGKDYRSNFISRGLAVAAISLISNGEVWGS